VAVGWPATLARISYAAAPGLTERGAGAALRRALARADPAPRTEGALMRPVAAGTGTSGGFRHGRGSPGAGRSLGLALGGAAALLGLEMMVRRLRG
jgi:hypothetical protein